MHAQNRRREVLVISWLVVWGLFACEFVQRRPGITPQLVNYPFSHKLQNICTKEAVTWFKLVLTSD